MKRRKLLGYAAAGLGGTLGLRLGDSAAQAQTAGVTIRSLGHTSFLFTGGGRRILVNPFRRVGCTAGFPSPAVPADIVMISSRLFDEGYINELPGEPRLLTDPGVYDFDNLRVQALSPPTTVRAVAALATTPYGSGLRAASPSCTWAGPPRRWG